MGRSDAIDGQLAGTKVAAAPLRAAAMAIINGDNAELVKARAQQVIDNLDKATDAQGNVGYGVLKQERSTFGQYLESQQTPARGEPTIKNTLVGKTRARSRTRDHRADERRRAPDQPRAGRGVRSERRKLEAAVGAQAEPGVIDWRPRPHAIGL